MFVLVLAAEADETRQTVSFLIACLVGIAIALALLTVWYWFYSDPKRRAEDQGRSELLDGSAEPDPGPPRVEAAAPASETGANPRPGLLDGTGGGDAADPGGLVSSDHLRTDDQADFVTGPMMARQTWDFVAAAKRAEDDPKPPERVLHSAAPRIDVPDRTVAEDQAEESADELAVARRRRERQASRGLSDDAWAAGQRSVFDKLDG